MPPDYRMYHLKELSTILKDPQLRAIMLQWSAETIIGLYSDYPEEFYINAVKELEGLGAPEFEKAFRQMIMSNSLCSN